MANTITFREQMKGFPLWQMFVVSLIRFAEPMAFTSLFPYMYFMIRDFNVAKDKAEIATYSGYLSASFSFFQFLCCIQWGKASDKVGRKPILLIGLMGTSLSLLMFGFSTNIYMAFMARSLMGVLNGNIAVLRTTIGEVATERRHQAVAFATLPMLWNLGAVIGPMIGGSKYLTRPKGSDVSKGFLEIESIPGSDITHNFVISKLHNFLTYLASFLLQNVSSFEANPNSFYERFITKHPYALSNIVVSSFLWFSFIAGVLFLEETNPKFVARRDPGVDVGDYILRKLGYKIATRPWKINYSEAIEENEDEEDCVNEYSPLMNIRGSGESSRSSELESDTSPNSDSFPDSITGLTRRTSEAIIRRYSENELLRPTLSRSSIRTTQGFNRRVFTPPVLATVVASFITSLHLVVYMEFLPIFLAGEVSVKDLSFPFKIRGGFGYDSTVIGKLLSTSGLVGVLGVSFIFPYIDRHYSASHAYRTTTIMYPVGYALLPFLIFTLPAYNPTIPAWVTKASLYVLSGTLASTSSIGFPNSLVMIHRASAPEHRAFINGTVLSLNSLARCVGPVTWGYLISACERWGIGQVPWLVLSGMAVASCFQAFGMGDYDYEAVH